MAVPASALEGLTRELFDPANLVSEFRLHQMNRDVTSMYGRGEIDSFAFHFVSEAIQARLGDVAGARRHALGALAHRRDAVTLNNAAIALLRVGDVERAAELLVEAIEQVADDVGLLANLAEVFAAMDAWAEARDTFVRAREVANADNPEHLFRLADAAGAVHEYAQSVDLFARFLARRHGVDPVPDSLAFIDGCPDGWWVGLKVPSSVARAVARVRSVREARPELHDALDEEATRSAVEVLDDLASYRGRANRAVLSDG